MLTLRQALTRAADQLAANPHLRECALADASLLLQHLLGIDRATLRAHPERTLDREQQAAYQRLLERRLAFEPIQYILGTQEFYGLTLKVTPAVLIPRPETELLVESVLAQLPRETPLRITDVGTGSGAIALAIATALPQADVTALELSLDAIVIAQQNAAAHHLSNIVFLVSDLLAAVAEPQDVIVSNPPYIAERDAVTLHPQVREHEPAPALFAGPEGLSIYERLIPQARGLLKPGGLLGLEFGHGQQPALAQLLAGWNKVIFLKDLQSIPRVVLARRP